MLRLTPLAVCLAWLAMLASLPAVVSAQTPASAVRVTQVDTSKYPEVTIYVAVNDAAGQPRSGLSLDDFRLTEDGVPVDITSFAGGGYQINTALVIDRSGSMERVNKLEGAREAAHTFIDQMGPSDQTTVIAFNDRTQTLQPLTSEQDKLHDAIDRLRTNSGTALYDAVISGVDALRGVGGRRVLLVLTDGQDCRDVDPDVCPSYYGSNASLQEAIAYANRYEQPLYVVGLGDRRSPDSSESAIKEEVLQRFASETYGEYFYAPDANELAALYARLAGQVQDEYMLTYISPRPFYDGTRRDIQISVGAVTSSGGYLERHLINVDSDPLIGLLLLLPLVGLLLLPSAVQRVGGRGKPVMPAAPAESIPIEDETSAASLPGSAAVARRAAPPMAATDVTQVVPRAANQPPAQHAPAVCANCGGPLRPGARFCGQCGARMGG